MFRKNEILSTVRMIQEENLDVRTVTMGINLNDCADHRVDTMIKAVQKKIQVKAGSLVRICDEISTRYGIAVVNKRLSISAASILLNGHPPEVALQLAVALDRTAESVQIDLLGGFSALVHKGIVSGEMALINSLPEVLAKTRRVCSSINVATTKAGINVDAVKLIADTILKISQATEDVRGFGCAKLVVFANIPEDNPFMAGTYLGEGEPDCVINVGVSGPGVVKRAVERFVREHPSCSLDEIAEEVKHTAFRVTRTGELIGREVASRLGIPFGVVDLSLAPTPRIGDSVGEIYQAMGISSIGAPGTTAAVAMINDAVKKGGAFASSSVGGLSGAFIPVTEDHALSHAVTAGTLSLEKLEAMSAVCSVGLDMIVVPGDISAEALAGVILDECAIGVFNRKTTGIRIIPVPGAKAGEFIDFGGLFGAGAITNFVSPTGGEQFVNRGGQIPAPIQSLVN